IVFVGDRGNGPGIFASLANPTNPMSPRILARVVGENVTTNGPNAELGTNSFGAALYFTSFDFDSRVGIAHFPFGPAGVIGDSFTVCFIASPNDANLGATG